MNSNGVVLQSITMSLPSHKYARVIIKPNIDALVRASLLVEAYCYNAIFASSNYKMLCHISGAIAKNFLAICYSKQVLLPVYCSK